MTDIVIRKVAEGVWTFSKPFARLGFVPIGGRSTAIQLANGDVWVLASTPLSAETKSTIDRLGLVKYIMAASDVHSMYIDEFKSAYPGAKVIGVKGLVAKKRGKIVFDGLYGSDAPGTRYGFEPEIESCHFSGFKGHDVAWFHSPSRTLIQADLLINLPPNEQYSKSKSSPTIPIVSSWLDLNPWSKQHKDFLWSAGKDKEAMKRDAETVAGWDFDCIVPCHGDVIERNGKEAWREAYKWYLDGGKKFSKDKSV